MDLLPLEQINKLQLLLEPQQQLVSLLLQLLVLLEQPLVDFAAFCLLFRLHEFMVLELQFGLFQLLDELGDPSSIPLTSGPS